MSIIATMIKYVIIFVIIAAVIGTAIAVGGFIRNKLRDNK